MPLTPASAESGLPPVAQPLIEVQGLTIDLVGGDSETRLVHEGSQSCTLLDINSTPATLPVEKEGFQPPPVHCTMACLAASLASGSRHSSTVGNEATPEG